PAARWRRGRGRAPDRTRGAAGPTRRPGARPGRRRSRRCRAASRGGAAGSGSRAAAARPGPPRLAARPFPGCSPLDRSYCAGDGRADTRADRVRRVRFPWRPAEVIVPTRDLVVIGGSAGGIEALTNLVAELPGDLRAALFVVVHVAPTAVSTLPAILARHGSLAAKHPTDDQPIEAGMIYAAPPDHHPLLRPPPL